MSARHLLLLVLAVVAGLLVPGRAQAQATANTTAPVAQTGHDDGLGPVAGQLPAVSFSSPHAAKGGAIELPALSASTRTDFIANATQAGRGGTSPIGQAIQSHAERSGSFFRSAGGNARKNTELGQQFLDDLFANPGTTVTHRVHKVHGPVVDVRLPNGAGAQFSGQGRFIGLLERFTPR